MSWIDNQIKPLLATIKSSHQLIPLLVGLAGKEIVTRVKPDESGIDYYSREIGISQFKFSGQNNSNSDNYNDLEIDSITTGGYEGASLLGNDIKIDDEGIHLLFFKPSFSSLAQRPTIGLRVNTGGGFKEFEGSTYIRANGGANESSDMLVHPLDAGDTSIQMIRRANSGTVNLIPAKSSLFIFHIVEKLL